MNDGSIHPSLTSPHHRPGHRAGTQAGPTTQQDHRHWMDGSQRVKNQRMESIIKHLLTNQFTGNMIGDSIHEDTHRLYYNIPSVLPPIFKNTDNLNKLKPPFDPDEIYCAGLRWAVRVDPLLGVRHCCCPAVLHSPNICLLNIHKTDGHHG